MQNTTEKPSSSKMPMEEINFDFDEFNFKPINKGLGFHHGEKDKLTHIKKSVQPVRQGGSVSSAQMPSTKPASSQHANISVSQEASSKMMGMPSDLQAFYGGSANVQNNRQEIKATSNKLKVEVEKKYQEASLALTFSSWLIDITLILAMFSAFVFGFTQVVGINALEFLKVIEFEMMAIFGAFFCLVYLSYFSILDLTSSPGKSLLNLRLIGNEEKLSFKSTTIRSIISLLSILLIGLPALIDFSGKLSDTKVVEND
ncbi:RDD family protein [Halobacteriovorax sp. GB3]|uniref:RDD family protein n=1 Tax=Halobacteriovorax sp. GB3 TaxID=2719615 RepID=UPI002362C08C|nr:RDD family protein [Halobacteriovorax sp. GB3]MDD0854647.1 RDD family protein [Halobacteriovorax sp. GB3]